jgi:hypothetical protein
MQTLAQLLSEKPYLAWYVKDKSKLSPESAFEHILNNGNWDDYTKAENALGVQQAEELFKRLKAKKRVNLRPQTVNYFNKYFEKYA